MAASASCSAPPARPGANCRTTRSSPRARSSRSARAGTQTAYLTARLVELIVDSGLLPDGSIQLVCGSVGDLFVPAALAEQVAEAARDRLAKVVVGNPAEEGVRMGALAGLEQREEVRRSVKALLSASRIVFGDPDHVDVVGASAERGAFMAPLLLRADDSGRPEPHQVEAFGPVSKIIGYQDTTEVVDLAARGRGSLVGSIVTADIAFARDVVLGLAPWHGRLLVLDREDGAESTGHGSPLPALVHGGPARAGTPTAAIRSASRSPNCGSATP